MNPETIIQREIMDYLKKHEIFHYRVNADKNTVGIPDLIVCYRGHFVGLEVKTQFGTPSAIQLKMKEEIEKSGGYVIFPTCVSDVEQLLNEIDTYEEVCDFVGRFGYHINEQSQKILNEIEKVKL